VGISNSAIDRTNTSFTKSVLNNQNTNNPQPSPGDASVFNPTMNAIAYQQPSTEVLNRNNPSINLLPARHLLSANSYIASTQPLIDTLNPSNKTPIQQAYEYYNGIREQYDTNKPGDKGGNYGFSGDHADEFKKGLQQAGWDTYQPYCNYAAEAAVQKAREFGLDQQTANLYKNILHGKTNQTISLARQHPDLYDVSETPINDSLMLQQQQAGDQHGHTMYMANSDPNNWLRFGANEWKNINNDPLNRYEGVVKMDGLSKDDQHYNPNIHKYYWVRPKIQSQSLAGK
jgi:hypothetical protein